MNELKWFFDPVMLVPGVVYKNKFVGVDGSIAIAYSDQLMMQNLTEITQPEILSILSKHKTWAEEKLAEFAASR